MAPMSVSALRSLSAVPSEERKVQYAQPVQTSGMVIDCMTSRTRGIGEM